MTNVKSNIKGIFTCTIPDPPDPDPWYMVGTYAECVEFARAYAGSDWPFEIIRTIDGQLVHVGSGWGYDENDEDWWNGTIREGEDWVF